MTEVIELPKPSDPAPPKERSAQQAQQREMTAFERATLSWAKAAVYISTLAALVISAQWYEMHTGGVDTHELAVSAGHQANAAKAQADQLTNLVTQVTAQASAAQATAESTKAIAERTLKQAIATNSLANETKRAADAAQQNVALATRALEVQERAWLSITSINAASELGDGFKAKVTFNNTGKSPAFDAILNSAWSLDIPPVPSRSYAMLKIASKALVMPGMGKESGEIVCPIKFSTPELMRLKGKIAILYFFGEVSYRDVFSKMRNTKFCTFFDPDTKTFMDCPSYNEAN